MIGNSGNIHPNSYHTHTHEHEITKCIHETKKAKPESGGGAAAAGIKASMVQVRREQESFSLRELLTGGLRSLFTRAFGFWGRLGAEEGQGKEVAEDRDKGLREAANLEAAAHGVTVSSDVVASSGVATSSGVVASSGVAVSPDVAASPAGDMAANVMAAAMVRPEAKREEAFEGAERKVNHVESAVNGGLKKGQGGIQKFWQKFGEAAAKAGQFLRRKKKAEDSLSRDSADFEIGDDSFLLDSYNKMGEYSSLAQDRSLEGKFWAKG